MSDSNSTAEQPPNIEPVSDGLPRDEEGKYFPPMYEAAEGEIPPLKSASTPEKLVKSMHVWMILNWLNIYLKIQNYLLLNSKKLIRGLIISSNG